MNLQKKVGKIVTVEGRISDIPWQHIIMSVFSHQHIYYFDLEDSPQIVIYTKEEIECSGKLVVTGEVVEVKAPSKRPSKIDDDEFAEYHILVDKWECLT